MRRFSVVSIVALVAAPVANASGSHRLKGTFTKSGTYVMPHRQTNPDSSEIKKIGVPRAT